MSGADSVEYEYDSSNNNLISATFSASKDPFKSTFKIEFSTKFQYGVYDESLNSAAYPSTVGLV